jgi:hypothetical protein
MDSWYRKWPASLVGGNKPSCQPASIPIGSTLFTNNTALPWTVDAVGLLSNGTITAMPSLVYQADEMTDCELLMITMSMYMGVEPGEPTTFMDRWLTELGGKVYCRIYTPPLGLIQLNLTSTWSFWKYEIEGDRLSLRPRNFLGRDETYFSLLWAESLLWLGHSQLMEPLNGAEAASSPWNVDYTGISMQFVRHSEFGSMTTNIRDHQFFHIRVEILETPHRDEVQYYKYLITESDLARFLVEDAVAMNLTPNIWLQADFMSKAFLSTMWTDLGQVSATPNILADPELLQHFTKRNSVTNLNKELPDGEYDPSPENDALLGVRPSVLATNYLCQVPRRKPWGSLIIAILVADLVLLRALWTVVGFVSTYFVKRRDPLANTCETCAKSLREEMESGDEQISPAGGSAVELEHLNGGDSVPGRSRNPSLNESLLSRGSGSLRR